MKKIARQNQGDFFTLGASQQPSYMLYADKPPAEGGLCVRLTPQQIKEKFQFDFTENLLIPQNMTPFNKVYLRHNDNYQNDVINWLLNPPIDRLAVCFLSSEVGCGVFALDDFHVGDVVAVYTGSLVEDKATTFTNMLKRLNDSYGMKIYDPNKIPLSFSISCQNRGGIARFIQHCPFNLEDEVQLRYDSNFDPKVMKQVLRLNGDTMPESQIRSMTAMANRMRSMIPKDEIREKIKHEDPDYLADFSLKFNDPNDSKKIAWCNTQALQVCLEGYPFVFFMAIREIKKHEQVSVHYGNMYWQVRNIAPCLFYKTGSIFPDTLYTHPAYPKKRQPDPSTTLKPASNSASTSLQSKLEELTSSIQHQIITSNNILPRTQYPQYQSIPQQPVSEILLKFKERLVLYRSRATELVNQLPDLPHKPQGFNSFKVGTFPHLITTSIALHAFGLGECAECAAKVAIQLIMTDTLTSFAVVGIHFKNPPPKAEQGHMVVVGPLVQAPQPLSDPSLEAFLKSLPSDCWVMDAFLNTCFLAHNPSPQFTEYLKAYGTQAEINQCHHIKNGSKELLMPYILPASGIKQKMEQLREIKEDLTYPAEKKIRMSPPNSLTQWLQKWLGVKGETYMDPQTHLADGVFYCSEAQQAKIAQLSKYLQTPGRWMFLNGQRVYVFEGLNVSEQESLLPKKLHSFLQKQIL